MCQDQGIPEFEHGSTRHWPLRARSEALVLPASRNSSKKPAERSSFKKPAPGEQSARSANSWSSDRIASQKREAGVAINYVGMPSRNATAHSANRFSIAKAPHDPFSPSESFSYRYSPPSQPNARPAPARSHLAQLRIWLVWEAGELPNGPLLSNYHHKLQFSD